MHVHVQFMHIQSWSVTVERKPSDHLTIYVCNRLELHRGARLQLPLLYKTVLKLQCMQLVLISIFNHYLFKMAQYRIFEIVDD